MYKLLPIIALLINAGSAEDCMVREFGDERIVCVCNSTYCDSTPDDAVPESGTFSWYMSSKSGLRMKTSSGNFVNEVDVNDHEINLVLTVDKEKRYQTIFGFGGAFTDSTGINIKRLSSSTQENLLRSYFDKSGSRYSIGRVPIAGTDFSTRAYTYADSGEFALTNEDYEYKMPLINKASELNPNLKLFACAWSAPPYMKTNDAYTGLGFLKPEYYSAFADYILKFIEEYEKMGFKIWAVSTGNEPLVGFYKHIKINTLDWLPHTLSEWVKNNLGPTLTNSKYNDTIIVGYEDQRSHVPQYVQELLADEETKNYITGISVHWYFDTEFPPERIDQLHHLYPDKFILMSEASLGNSDDDKSPVKLGSWDRAERYALDIIENLNHWMVGWIDWNMALDMEGGPSWAKNFLDSPIIINPEMDEFYKQPMYYAIKHFSRFVDRGSVKVHINSGHNISTIAFVTPNDETVVVLYNGNDDDRTVRINDKLAGHNIIMELPMRSLHTVIYKE